MMVANVKKKLAVAKQELLKFDAGRFNLRKLNELEVRKQFQIMILTRFTALENLSDIEDISRSWKNIKENIKTSATGSLGLYELKEDKQCFDYECVGFIRSKEAS
jgi:hypothetical protein